MSNNAETRQSAIQLFSVSDIHSFLEWMGKQPKDYMGGEFLYDVKSYYKRLKQSEMFDYWLERVYSR